MKQDIATIKNEQKSMKEEQSAMRLELSKMRCKNEKHYKEIIAKYNSLEADHEHTWERKGNSKGEEST